MTIRFPQIAASTALVASLASAPLAWAQASGETSADTPLAGMTIPGCRPDIEPVDAAALGDAAMDRVSRKAAFAELLPRLVKNESLCVARDGTLRLTPEARENAALAGFFEAADETTETKPRKRDGAQAAAAAGDAQAVETTETQVTEQTARSSDEDFAETTSQAEAAAGNDDGGGLSNFEKFALGAAGIAVLSQVIGDKDQVVSNTGDRVVVQQEDGDYYVLKDDDVLLRRPGSDVKTETFQDGSSRSTVTRADGSSVETVTSADGRVLRRVRIMPDGTRVLLFDDTQAAEPVNTATLPQPVERAQVSAEATDGDALRQALMAERMADLDRRFSLQQVRDIKEVRQLMPEITVDSVNFETNSAAIRPDEARELLALGDAMREMIAESPDELFLVEGHTDAVGGAAYNLALSDRRAESVALALTEYFDVPPENLIVQGYGEGDLLIKSETAERANRRATVRRITPLINGTVTN